MLPTPISIQSRDDRKISPDKFGPLFLSDTRSRREIQIWRHEKSLNSHPKFQMSKSDRRITYLQRKNSRAVTREKSDSKSQENPAKMSKRKLASVSSSSTGLALKRESATSKRITGEANEDDTAVLMNSSSTEEEEEEDGKVSSSRPVDANDMTTNSFSTSAVIAEDDFTLIAVDGSEIQILGVLAAPQADAIAAAIKNGLHQLHCKREFCTAAVINKIKNHIYGDNVSCDTFGDAAQLLLAADTLGMSYLRSAALGCLRVLITPQVALQAYVYVARFGTQEEIEQLKIYIVRNLEVISKTDSWLALSVDDVRTWVREAKQSFMPGPVLVQAVVEWLFRSEHSFNSSNIACLLGEIRIGNADRPMIDAILAQAQIMFPSSPDFLRKFGVVETSLSSNSDAWGYLLDVARKQAQDMIFTSKVWRHIDKLCIPLMGLSCATYQQKYFTFGGMGPSHFRLVSFPSVYVRERFPSLAQRGPKSNPTRCSNQFSLSPQVPFIVRQVESGHATSSTSSTSTSMSNMIGSLISQQPSQGVAGTACNASVVDAAIAVARNQFAIILGGCDVSTGKIVSSASAFIFESKQWIRITQLPAPRVAASASWLCIKPNSRYLVVVAAGCDQFGHAQASTLALEVSCRYDQGAQLTWTWGTAWEPLSDLRVPRFAAASCVLNDTTMIIIGGVSSQGDKTLSSVEVFSITSITNTSNADQENIFRQIQQPRRTHPRSKRKKLSSNSNQRFANTFLASICWQNLDDLPAPRHSMGAFALKCPDGHQRIILVGGRDATHRDLASVLQLRFESTESPTSGWQYAPHDLPSPRSSFGYTLVDSAAELCLLVAGGVCDNRIADTSLGLFVDFRTKSFAPNHDPGLYSPSVLSARIGASTSGAASSSSSSSSSTSSSSSSSSPLAPPYLEQSMKKNSF